MHCIGCEQFPPLVRAEGDEKHRVGREDPSQTRREFWISAHASLVAASLWDAQCRCNLAARHVAHRATATVQLRLPRKRHAKATFRALYF
jgi:hypothetical protein